MRQIQPIALPLFERLKQEKTEIQANLQSTQARLQQVEEERDRINLENQATLKQLVERNYQTTEKISELWQVQQKLETLQNERLQLQAQVSELQNQLQQTHEQLTQSQRFCHRLTTTIAARNFNPFRKK